MKPPGSIHKPCPLRKDLFPQAGAKCAFCTHCGQNVHNLSAMTPEERWKLRETWRPGVRLCVSYRVKPNGHMVTADPPRPALWMRLRRLISWIVPFGLAACAAPKEEQKHNTSTLQQPANTPAGHGNADEELLIGDFEYFGPSPPPGFGLGPWTRF